MLLILQNHFIDFLEPGFAEIKLSWHEKGSNENIELLKWLCDGIMMEDEL